jgi:UDP-N-acetylglucosamine 3-dehydrogenase
MPFGSRWRADDSDHAGPPLRVGVIGGGVMAQTHVQSLLAMAGARLVAVAAPEIDVRLSELCRQRGIATGADAGWLLTEVDLDAVVIATPTDTHVDLIERAAGQGLHVVCEKPLGRTAALARLAVEACSRAGVKLVVAHVVRYFPAYAHIRRSVLAGEIGPVGMAKCRRVSGPPATARAWYADQARSGGVIMDMGIHDFDWLRWCLGPVERVSALEGYGGRVAMVTMAHTAGAISVTELSWMDPKGFAMSVEVSGPSGLLSHDSRTSATFALSPWPASTSTSPAEVSDPGPLVNPYQVEMIEAVTWFGGGPEPRVSAADGVAAVALAEAAHESATTRQPVTLDVAAIEGVA